MGRYWAAEATRRINIIFNINIRCWGSTPDSRTKSTAKFLRPTICATCASRRATTFEIVRRLVPRPKARRRTRARSVASASTSVPSANGSGCREIRGPTTARSASSATSTCIRTNSVPWRNPTAWTFPISPRSIRSCCVKSAKHLDTTADESSSCEDQHVTTL
uniref:(northern house mosquito) hypothetical protein n=1 Tax=Culex pipiens TaxID=7175 RepID=A0A8D8I9H4_CULPI